MLLTENHLDEWVRANSRDAQGVIVELVWRLAAASSPRPNERRFPLGDSIGQHGPDGVLDVELGFDPFIPDGKSLWEIGTGLGAGAKATSDYADLTSVTPEAVRRESAFIFVTPLSGRRDWPHTWNEGAQADWIEQRRKCHEWREVRVVDGTRLVDWLHQFPPVEVWLAGKMGLPTQELEVPEQRWAVLETIGDPPPLAPRVFLVGREEACAKLGDVFGGAASQLKIDTHFPDQVADLVCAFIAAMGAEAKIDAVGRCLIISGPNAWNEIATRRDSHVLIADFDLDEGSGSGTKLLEKARRAGHTVIFWGSPGGIPHPNRVVLPHPKDYQLKEALEAAGYTEERARTLAQKSGGNLTSLLRVLHARWRSHVVRYGRPAPDVHAREREASPRAAGTAGAWTWAALMRRVLDLDVLACPRCGGRLRVLATVQDPRAVQAILAYLARSGAPAPPGPAPPAPAAIT